MDQRPLNTGPSVIVVTATKSMGLAIALSVLFGPLGLLYASIVGGLIMLVISVPLAMVTFGVSLFLTWPVCIVWSIIATNSCNRRLLLSQGTYLQQ